MTTISVTTIAVAVAAWFWAASAPNEVDRKQTAEIASLLTLGMREEDAEKLLLQNGIKNTGKVGCSHGWTSGFDLSDRCHLFLHIAPKQARADGAWTDGLLQGADIQSNGAKIVSIKLRKAH